MNYVTLLNSFLASTEKLKSTDVAAFLAIFHYSNLSGWKEWVNISSSQAMKISRLNKRTWFSCLQELERHNFIKVLKGERSSTFVSINPVEIWCKNAPDTQNALVQKCTSTGAKMHQIRVESGAKMHHYINKKTKQESFSVFRGEEEPIPATTVKQKNLFPAMTATQKISKPKPY
jgi:hypothetical protein